MNSEFARLCLNEFGWGETRFTADELALRLAAAARAIRSEHCFSDVIQIKVQKYSQEHYETWSTDRNFEHGLFMIQPKVPNKSGPECLSLHGTRSPVMKNTTNPTIRNVDLRYLIFG